MVITNDTRVKVPEPLIDLIGMIQKTKHGSFIITGFAEVPVPSNKDPRLQFFYVFGVKDKGHYNTRDVDQWKHNQRMRNKGQCADCPGVIFSRIKTLKANATSLAISA